MARHFLIEDEQVIGIFRDCFRSAAHSYADFKYPTSLQEYIELQTEGRSFIVADLVLEKPNLRLVNRWGSNRQSKFLRDLVLPGLMGIGAHYAGWVERLEGEGREAGWQGCDRAAVAESLAQVELGKLLTRELLFDSCYNVAASDIFLSDHSPLVLFYDASSPLNVDLSRVDPWMAPWTAPKELSYLGDCCPGDFRANVTGMQPFPQSPPTP
ncbi:hypothetical protein PGN35_014320 [Nodosilinea sp. PGN35]|uniref:hypothetical protein n=1 Tax=Nodosilinea sp. PGN35 TaxID=3020489 RepID=UPI0023B25400|nr:hypothetical protein [Nodosilinea sp. TSF1-S3]MDF0364863.1 hypothetical protein [Nodosilinea sp. TSF1-S3]